MPPTLEKLMFEYYSILQTRLSDKAREVHPEDVAWDNEWREQVRRFRLRAILRGSLPRTEIGSWIASLGDGDRRQRAKSRLGDRGKLVYFGFSPLKGGVLAPSVSSEFQPEYYQCTGSLLYCLPTAVCLHEGFRIMPCLEGVHVAKGHTGSLRGSQARDLSTYTMNREALLDSRSRKNPNVMGHSSIVSHFFAKRREYDLQDILHLLVRWWRKSQYGLTDLERAADRFGVSTIMSPYIQMLQFVPQKRAQER